MKRILSFILCLMLACTAAVSLADDVLAPSIKIQRQMQNDGNGIKGSFRIDGNAEAEKDPLIAAIQGAEYEILRNASGDRWHLVVFQKDEEGQQINKTELAQEETGLYIRSDFVPENVFRIPAVNDLIPESFRGTGENPSILPALVSMMSVTGAEKARWDSAAEKYTGMLETWLAEYAQTPELQRRADGTTEMKLIYVVPAEDIGNEIAALVKAAAEDPEAGALLAPALTEEQRSLYLNAGLEAYYREALNSFSLTGEIRFEKEVTTLGEMTGAGITLPLNPAVTGYRTLEIYNRGGESGYVLTGEQEIIRLILPGGLAELTGQAGFEGTGSLLRWSGAEEKKGSNLSLRFDIRKTFENHTDEETGRIHETHHLIIGITRELQNLPEGAREEDFPEFETISMEGDFHFSSKAPQSSPVTVESSVAFSRGEMNLTLSGKIKTAATWPFVPFGIQDVKPLSGLTGEEIAAVVGQWIQNAAGQVRRTAAE